MASIRPYRYKPGWWRAQVRRLGINDSGIFPSKTEASAWAALREAEISAGVRGNIPNLTVKDLLERYANDVSKGKKGERWERIRLDLIGRDRLAQVRLRVLDAPHVADWQQRRLQAVSSGSVRRERNLLNNVFEIARKEWRWLKANPFEGVRRPKDGKPRDRLLTDAEEAKLMSLASEQMQKAITVALETAMRAGEIASQPKIIGRVAYLTDSKTGEGREVPLSAKALKALSGLTLKAGSISALFAQLCREAKIDGLTFHDLKHAAMTRLSKKLDPWELCKMSGNKDLKLVLRVYYKANSEEVAKKL